MICGLADFKITAQAWLTGLPGVYIEAENIVTADEHVTVVLLATRSTVRMG